MVPGPESNRLRPPFQRGTLPVLPRRALNLSILGARLCRVKPYGDLVLAPARSVVKQHFPINGRIAADLCTSAMPTQSSERRVYPRLPAPKGTIVAWHSFNKRVVSAVDNLGLGGLYIRTADPPATGTFIQLLLDAPAGEVRARAAVQRSSPKQGMGVKFVAMAQEDRARFARWLKALSS
jgi:hypothetical protein